MKEYLRLLQYSRPIRWVALRYFLASLFHSIFGVLNLAMLIPLLEVLFQESAPEDIAAIKAKGIPSFDWSIDYFVDTFNYYFYQIIAENGPLQALMFACSATIIFIFLSNFFAYMRSLQAEAIRAKTTRNIRRDVFKKLSSLHIGYFANRQKGDLLARSTTDVNEVEMSIANSFTLALREPVSIAVYFVALFKMSPEMTVFTLTVVPVLGATLAALIRRIKKKADNVQIYQGKLLSLIDEAIDGLRIVKAFNATGYAQDKFDQHNTAYASYLRQYGNRVSLAPALSQALGVTIVVGTVMYGGSLILNSSEQALSGKVFIAFVAILSQLMRPLKGITNDWSKIQRGLSAGRRILELLDTPNPIEDHQGTDKLEGFKKQISLEEVSFAYENERVLKNISLQVEKGKTVALVGPSGAGKSTIADLIPRFYDVTEGRITVDEHDIRHLEHDSLLQQIGIVTQESVLFNDSIFNNIAFGKPNANKEEVIEAAKIANAHDFIMATENGYDTIVGDRGMKLSGGQKQRISIARAIFKNPPILILDEATSALDTESEKLVQDALEKLMSNRTSIVIAHRLSTIQHADEIIVLEQGQIVERGTHQELLDKGGLYKKLNMMQATL